MNFTRPVNPMQTKEIWVYIEIKDHDVERVVFEMVNEAVQLSAMIDGQVCACLIGSEVGEYLKDLQHCGIEKLYIIEDAAFDTYALDNYVSAFQNLVEKYRPFIILFGLTPYGSELAPKIAARLKLPYINEVKRLHVEDGHLLISKSCFNGKGYQNFTCRLGSPLVLTVLPGDMELKMLNVPSGMVTVYETIDHSQITSRTRYLGYKKGDPQKIDLKEADLIIAGGNGINKNFPLLETLGEFMGAAIGGSRPLVDDGLIPFERQIGITGRSVEPRLLITCGISGAREFVAGIEKAKFIIAVDIDPGAAIFNVADLCIQGDVNNLIPILIHKLKDRMQEKSLGKQEDTP